MSYSWANHLDAKYYTIIALFLLLIFLSVVVCVYRRNLTLSAILLNQSARFLGSSTGAFLLILIFIVITIIFIGVNFVVHWILLTSSATSVDKSQVWLQWSGNKPLQIIHFILFIWGIQFLKDSCRIISYFSQLSDNG
jgi:NADH:ubiquinone oxidoreductase subunit 6 (subunit J)